MKKYVLIILLFMLSISTFATHERAAEITYRCLNTNTFLYEITLITYTYTPSPADRPQMTLVWGDGTSSLVDRTNKLYLPNDISRNEYVTTHTFPGDGTYKITMEDPNRNYGILNIPNSVNIPMFVETELIISPFINPKNSSPVLLNPPIDEGCVGVPFYHNPGAYDPDGDSLSYRLVTCRGAGGLNIAGYTLPLTNHTIAINPVTGDFYWDSPVMQGEYNIAILIEEWRNGVRIGYITRDMQIIIATCNNHPPKIDPIPDTCVTAGDTLQFNVHAYSPDGLQVTLSCTGGPLNLATSPAQFYPASGTPQVTEAFYWATKCIHVRKQPYQLSFKVADNGASIHLVSFASASITVNGPAPQNFTANAVGNTIALNWNRSICTNAIGYKMYRRDGYYGYHHAYCETGVPAYTGYVQIATIHDVNDTTFIDNNNGQGLIQGIDYCYIVIAYYSDGAESYASLEACAVLIRDVPIITNVSITNTDLTNGSDTIIWSKATIIDTAQTPGPYKYLIYRSNDFFANNLVLIDSLNSINDTIYHDISLNTTNNPYSYRIDFYNDLPNRFLIGSTHIASSVYLSLMPTDKKMILNYNFNVPWDNQYYIIYRKNLITDIFDSVGTSNTTTYTDKGLTNGVEYCYYVKSIGAYSIDNITNPIINLSQQACASPIDKVAPCPPVLSVQTLCQLSENDLSWINTDSCSQDIAKYNIWYKPFQSGDFSIIKTINDRNITQFKHTDLSSVAGCYVINAIDSNNNVGLMSNVICVDIDSCDTYVLPNIFTPNGDGKNDKFVPFPYKSVEKIDIKIYNRWGNLVFKTSDPDINWDGKDMQTKQLCADGVYFYVCDVYEIRLKGITPRQLHGSVTILR